jgi:hypothetical protein
MMSKALVGLIFVSGCTASSYVSGEGPKDPAAGGQTRWFVAGKIVERCLQADRPRGGMVVTIERDDGTAVASGKSAADGTFHLTLDPQEGPRTIHIGDAALVASGADDLELLASFPCPAGPNLPAEGTGVIEARVVKGDVPGPGSWNTRKDGESTPVVTIKP